MHPPRSVVCRALPAFPQLTQSSLHLPPQFIHVLLNDSQYLLQDALETLPKVPALLLPAGMLLVAAPHFWTAATPLPVF